MGTNQPQINNIEYSYIDIIRNGQKEDVYAFFWDGEERKAHKIPIESFYFYIPESQKQKAIELGCKIEGGFKTIYNLPVLKIYPSSTFYNSHDFFQFLENFTITFESDVSSLDRWIDEKKPKFSMNPRILYWDIETLKTNAGEYSLAKNAEGKICSLTFIDSFTNIKSCFFLGEIILKNCKTYCFDSETTMLK